MTPYKEIIESQFGKGIYILLGGLVNEVAAKLIELDVYAEKADIPCFLYNIENHTFLLEEVYKSFEGKEIILYDDLFRLFNEEMLDKMVSSGAKTIIIALRDFQKFERHKVEYRYVVIESRDSIKTYKIPNLGE